MGIGLGIGRGHAPKSEPTLWLLQDEFATDLAAGSVNGTAAEPGPGTRTVVDTAGNKVYISSGSLAINGANSWDDTYISYASVGAWTAGRVLLTRILSTGGESLVDFIRSNWRDGVLFGDHLRAWEPAQNIIPTTLGYWHDLAIVTRASGHFLFLRRYGETTWALRWMRNNSLSATMPVSVQAASGALYVSHLRIPVDLWLPTPLASDGFGSAFGTSDGLGHAEGIAGGIGAGGSGKTWSNVGGTWSVSGGKAINTPTTGAELIVNGDMELDSNWQSEGSPITNERSTERVHSGTYSRKLSADSNGDAIGQGVSGTVAGMWYRVQAWIYLESGASIYIQDYNQGAWAWGTTVTGSWQLAKLTYRIGNGGSFFTLRSFEGTPVIAYIDDASFVQLTFSEFLSLSDLSCSSVHASVAITKTAPLVSSGMALSWDSATVPNNGVIVELWGGNIYISKRVAGTWTNVSSTAFNYSAGAALVVAKAGTEYRVYYNNALVTVQTISDASIVNNTLHGLFSTDASNTFDNFVCYATGTGGEYAELDKWS